MLKGRTASSSLGLLGLLFLAFLILKLCGVIAWPWWKVTAPLWIPVVSIFTVLFGFLFFWFTGELFLAVAKLAAGEE